MPEEIRVTEPLDRLAALLMQAPTPICVTRGPTHRVEIMNAAFEAMAGVRGARGRAARRRGVGVRRRPAASDGAVVLRRRARRGRRGARSARGRALLQPGLRAAARSQRRDRRAHDLRGRRDRARRQPARLRAARSSARASWATRARRCPSRSTTRARSAASPSWRCRRFADWCTVSETDEKGGLRRLAVVHRDPARAPLVAEYERRFPPTEHRAGEMANALGSSHAVLRARVTDAELVEAAQSPDHLRVMRGLGCASCIIAPMIARGATVGVVSFMRSEPDHPYDAGDVAVAEELAHRAALAIDNARLYRAARRREETMRFFAEASAVLSSSLDYEAAFDKVAQLVVPSFADWCAVDVKEDGEHPPRSRSRTSTRPRSSSRASCSAAISPIPTRPTAAHQGDPHRPLRALREITDALLVAGDARRGAPAHDARARAAVVADRAAGRARTADRRAHAGVGRVEPPLLRGGRGGDGGPGPARRLRARERASVRRDAERGAAARRVHLDRQPRAQDAAHQHAAADQRHPARGREPGAARRREAHAPGRRHRSARSAA